MKLVTLNIWGGKVFDPLIKFLKDYSTSVDIFCFQEVFDNPPGIVARIQPEAKQDIYTDVEKVLGDFKGIFAPSQDNEESLTIFYRKSLNLINSGEKFVYRWKNAMEGIDATTYGINLQYVTIEKDGIKYTLCNLHGHWTPEFKGDNPARMEQSKNIKSFLDQIKGPKILAGDFNLAPETESMKILETSMRNLIKEYGVTNTRSHFYTHKIKFADYIMVSPEVKVKKFEVLQDAVSDHLPLFLEFD